MDAVPAGSAGAKHDREGWTVDGHERSLPRASWLAALAAAAALTVVVLLAILMRSPETPTPTQAPTPTGPPTGRESTESAIDCAPLWEAEALTPVPPEPAAGEIGFAGYTWNVRGSSGGPTSIGTFGVEQVRVRDDGALVLEQERTDGQWRSAELYTQRQGFGYGTYRWTVESDLSSLDPQVVLGLFTYEPNAPGNREIDIEGTRWGEPGGENMHATRHQVDGLISEGWRLSTDTATEHAFRWAPGEITWCSRDVDGEGLFATAFPTDLEPGNERVHMNLWIFGGVEPQEETRVVISDFAFAPA